MCARTSYVSSSIICASQIKRTGRRASSSPISISRASAAADRHRSRGAPPSAADATCAAHMSATPGRAASSAYVQRKSATKLPIITRRWKPSAAFASAVAKPFLTRPQPPKRASSAAMAASSSRGLRHTPSTRSTSMLSAGRQPGAAAWSVTRLLQGERKTGQAGETAAHACARAWQTPAAAYHSMRATPFSGHM